MLKQRRRPSRRSTKIPLRMPPRRSSFSPETEFPLETSLKNEARVFHAVIGRITAIFDSSHAWGIEEEAKRKQMQSYGLFCEKLLKDTAYSKQDYKDKTREFYYSIGLFFGDCDAQTQEKVLQGLEKLIAGSSNKQEIQYFLQEIVKEFQDLKKINLLDSRYNPKVAALLDLHFIAKAIHYKEARFSFASEYPLISSKRTSGLSQNTDRATRKLRHFSFMLMPSTDRKRKSFEVNFSTQLSDAIYDGIKTDDIVYHPNKVQNIPGGFKELYRNENTCYEDLCTLSAELLLILKNLELTPVERELIGDFLATLRYFLREQKKLCDRAKVISERVAYTNVEAIELFLNIYAEDCLRKQREYSESLLDYLEKISVLLQQHKNACDALKEEAEKDDTLKIIKNKYGYLLQTQFFKVCLGRSLHAKEMLKLFELDESNREKALTCYKEINYIIARDNHMRDARERGYARPAGLVNLLEGQLNKNKEYSVAYFLTHPDCDPYLKSFFLSFAKTQDDSMKKQLKFFTEICKILHMQPPSLKNLERLRRYFGEDSPLALALPSPVLQAIQQAFASDEDNQPLKIGLIVTALIPAAEAVSKSLNTVLEKFRHSCDIVDVLHSVPEIKEKLGEGESLASLSEEAINTLPCFWKEVFTDESGAFRQLLTRKKEQLITSRDIRKILSSALLLYGDIEPTLEQFIATKNLIAKDILEKEIDKQIDLLEQENIFHDDCLIFLKQNRVNISFAISEQLLLLEKEVLFLARYACTLLEIPYCLMDFLGQAFKQGHIEQEKIFSKEFLKSLQDTGKKHLDLSAVASLMSEQQGQYGIKNKKRLQQIVSATSVFRLFNLVNNQSDPNVYTQLKKRISTLATEEAVSSSSSRNLIPETHLKQKIRLEDGGDRRPYQDTASDMSAFSKEDEELVLEPEITTAVQCATNIDFQRLVDRTKEKITADMTHRWSVRKRIQTTPPTEKREGTSVCSVIEVYDQEELVFTAQTEARGLESDPVSPSTVQDVCVMAYRHKPEHVSMAVETIVESIPSNDKTLLEIHITAPKKRAAELTALYVREALKHQMALEVTLNGVVLKPKELHAKLQAVDESLAREYSERFPLPKEESLLQSLSAFFAPRHCGEKLSIRQRAIIPPPRMVT